MKLSVFIVIAQILFIQTAWSCNAMRTNKHKPSKVMSANVKKAYLSCAEEVKVEPEMILELRSGKWKENEMLKQWVYCVLVKSDLMTPQSVFQMDVALSKLNKTATPEGGFYYLQGSPNGGPPTYFERTARTQQLAQTREEYENNIDKCLPTKAYKPMEIAWRFAKCYHKKVPEYSLF